MPWPRATKAEGRLTYLIIICSCICAGSMPAAPAPIPMPGNAMVVIVCESDLVCPSLACAETRGSDAFADAGMPINNSGGADIRARDQGCGDASARL
jgi:hypothetical protein